MLDAMKTLAERFRYAREQAGYSKAELARALKVSRSAIGQIELGVTKNLKASTIVALELATGISGEWIETGKGSPRHRPGPLPDGAEDQVAKIYRELIKLPKEHRDKIEAEIDFLSKMNKTQE